MKRAFFSAAGVAVLMLLAVGCGVESGTNPVPEVTVGLTVSFDLDAPTNTLPGGGEAQTTTGPDVGEVPDSVTVSSGLLMVRSVRFKREPVTEVDTVITAADEDRDIRDASVRFRGPYVMEVNGTTLDLGTTIVPVGDYQQVTFVLQKARTSDELNGHGELTGSSILVTGKVWHGNVGRSFEFSTDYTSEFAVDGHFDLDASTDGVLNLEFGVGRWFHNGNHWLDPETPTNQLQILNSVRRNISGSIEVVN